MQDPSFYFIRFGSHFWVTEKFTVTAGYAHMWKAPVAEDGRTWTNEDRIYEQLQFVSSIGQTKVVQRIRNEQRWQEQVKDDVLTGDTYLSDRVRYLASFSIPVSSNPSMPVLALADEIALQFGAHIVTNTFDQNKVFVGIKKSFSPAWSFDFGYMPVYQQKSSGYQYELNHTVRLYFYFTPDFRKGKAAVEPASSED